MEKARKDKHRTNDSHLISRLAFFCAFCVYSFADFALKAHYRTQRTMFNHHTVSTGLQSDDVVGGFSGEAALVFFPQRSQKKYHAD